MKTASVEARRLVANPEAGPGQHGPITHHSENKNKGKQLVRQSRQKGGAQRAAIHNSWHRQQQHEPPQTSNYGQKMTLQSDTARSLPNVKVEALILLYRRGLQLSFTWL